MTVAVADDLYIPRGAAEAIMGDRSREVMLHGPAGTGKSRAVLEKVHTFLDAFPGTRVLLVRKTRVSLTQSALVTWEKLVCGLGHPMLNGPDREHRTMYKHPNGSELVVGGLGTAEDKIRIMSTEYDLIYVQEAREIAESEWEELTSRLRWGKSPYRQIIGDTNPDAPGHWIRKRAQRGALKLLPSKHTDNPSLTPEYLATLEALTGVRRKRLYEGLWVAAEGIVYEGWDPETHLVDSVRPDGVARVLGNDARYLAIDFGFTNPFVCQWWAVDADDRLTRYRELYRTGMLVEDAAHEIRRLSAGEKIRAIVCDHDAEDRATLERHLTCSCESVGLLPKVTCGTTAARKDVSPGIQVVAQRLRVAPDGRPRLSLLRDSRLTPDSLLAESGKPTCTEEEFEGYVWDDATKKLNPDGTYKAEEPLKKDDHGMDAMRYMVAYFDLNADLSKMHEPQRFDRGTPAKEPAVVRLPDNYPDPKKWYSRG